MRALDSRQHSVRHGRRLHAQLGVHAGHHHVKICQQPLLLVEGAVLQDVHLDAGEDSKRRQFLVEAGHEAQLGGEPSRVEPVGDRETGAVVGQDQVAVAECDGGFRHRPNIAAAIGPVAVTVAVALQRSAVRVGGRTASRQRGRFQLCQVDRNPPAKDFADDCGRGLAHTRQVLEPPRLV